MILSSFCDLLSRLLFLFQGSSGPHTTKIKPDLSLLTPEDARDEKLVGLFGYFLLHDLLKPPFLWHDPEYIPFDEARLSARLSPSARIGIYFIYLFIYIIIIIIIICLLLLFIYYFLPFYKNVGNSFNLYLHKRVFSPWLDC